MPITVKDAGIEIKKLPLPKKAEQQELGLKYITQFYNKCHNPGGSSEGGQFCGDNIEFTNLNAKEKKSVNRAIAAISKVHDLPTEYPKVYVEMSNSEALGPADGTYNSSENRILINENIGIGGPEITFTHEFGHHITLGQEGNWSRDQFQDRIDRTPALKNLFDALDNTSTMQGIKDIAAEEKAKGKEGGYFTYLADEREVFARAYAQYIAKGSGDKLLQTQIQEMQDNNPNMTWPDKEFGPVAKAFDEYFKDKHLK